MAAPAGPRRRLSRVDTAQRRARLARRQHLASDAGGGAVDFAGLAGTLAGLHATDPIAVVLAARARIAGLAATDVDRALYDERSVVRMLGMRRTMFVVPLELAPAIQGACAAGLVPGETRKLVKLIESAGLAEDGRAWLEAACEAALAGLAARGGEATAAELGREVPALGRQIVLAAGTPREARQSVSSRVLFLLAAEGRIVRARPLGGWTSTLNRWALHETWLGGGGRLAALGEDEAAAELARRWLRAFGPGTFADLKWWTGWSAGLTRRALAGVGAVEVSLEGDGVGLLLADDLEPVAACEPWAALLPGLDPTVMGWYEREWYFPARLRAELFDRTGNAGPTVWWDGRVVGGWAQRGDGEIVYELREDIGAEARGAIEAQAAALAAWVGAVRLTPRFRTPLERRLSTY